MVIQQDQIEFKPISITIESQGEACLFAALLDKAESLCELGDDERKLLVSMSNEITQKCYVS